MKGIKKKKKKKTKMSIREREVIESGPTLPAGGPRGGRDITNSGVLKRSKGFSPNFKQPNPGDWHLEDKCL